MLRQQLKPAGCSGTCRTRDGQAEFTKAHSLLRRTVSAAAAVMQRRHHTTAVHKAEGAARGAALFMKDDLPTLG